MSGMLPHKGLDSKTEALKNEKGGLSTDWEPFSICRHPTKKSSLHSSPVADWDKSACLAHFQMQLSHALAALQSKGVEL